MIISMTMNVPVLPIPAEQWTTIGPAFSRFSLTFKSSIFSSTKFYLIYQIFFKQQQKSFKIRSNQLIIPADTSTILIEIFTLMLPGIMQWSASFRWKYCFIPLKPQLRILITHLLKQGYRIHYQLDKGCTPATLKMKKLNWS